MRSYARIGKKGFCREKLIKPRKNKDMQGYETIWKEKLKFLWYATAVFKGRSKSLEFVGFLGWKCRIYTLFTPLEDRIGKAEIII